MVVFQSNKHPRSHGRFHRDSWGHINQQIRYWRSFYRAYQTMHVSSLLHISHAFWYFKNQALQQLGTSRFGRLIWKWSVVLNIWCIPNDSKELQSDCFNGLRLHIACYEHNLSTWRHKFWQLTHQKSLNCLALLWYGKGPIILSTKRHGQGNWLPDTAS